MTRFVLRYDLRLPDWAPHSRAELYDTALEQAVWADQLGLGPVMLSEHHGAPDGYLPSPLTFAAAVAARTEQVPITIAALVVPLHDPLRLVEDLLVLDNLSRGRVTAIVGAGYVPHEFAMFDVDLDDRVAAVEEFVAVLRDAWTGEPFRFRDRTVRVAPPPFSPQPVVLMGGSSPAAARRAARLGDWFIPENPQLWEHYRAELTRLGRPDPGPGVGEGPRFVHVAEDPEAAWETIGPYLLHEANAYGELAHQAGRDTGYHRVDSIEELRERHGEHYSIVTPDGCVELARQLGDSGAIGLHPLCGGMAPELSWSSLHLIEEQVLPALRG